MPLKEKRKKWSRDEELGNSTQQSWMTVSVNSDNRPEKEKEKPSRGTTVPRYYISVFFGCCGFLRKDDLLIDSVESVNIPPILNLNPFQLEIRSSPTKGRGVYATREIPRGSLVETSPVLLIPKDQYIRGVNESELRNYVFSWNWGPGGKGKNGDMVLALGLGSMFNHSRRPNVSYKLRPENLTIEYTTSSVIRTGEELCIYYGNVRFEGDDEQAEESDWTESGGDYNCSV
ncbi:hypothetical protein R1sor_023365 [Riccia sorocarpa]|uniref:SET domain-containing protein n=1 Tax=Riccia sorocarpa TaxID=122646 RepID=A0ABD3GRL6_9MARC